MTGIFTNFFEYMEVPAIPKESPSGKSIIVLDTNVLFDLYKYRKNDTEAFLNAIEKLGNDLFIPHYVLKEFWDIKRNDNRLFTIESVDHPPNYQIKIEASAKMGTTTHPQTKTSTWIILPSPHQTSPHSAT